MKKFLPIILLLAVPAIAAEPAAAPGLHAFTPPPGDIAVRFLRQIFGTIVDGGGTGDQQSLLGVMMGVFNTAVLFLAMLFVLYTTVKGTVDSAHDGVLLGKKMSEIWVPIRTVAGTALLLPLTSGFSLLQVAAIWLAMQGVGVADRSGRQRLATSPSTARWGISTCRTLGPWRPTSCAPKCAWRR